MRLPLLIILLFAFSLSASAANTPCSGSKGGIARCDGELFVCNDGSISGSKKNCAAMSGQPAARSALRAVDDGQCLCGSGTICVGPRGEHYCLTPSGRKSYVRK